ncbi:MAG: hypothetical protein HY912_19925 [Desulfomonile tiedjei]|uniref:Uncharacterized protein n=1 Tax=Desulfomonile tiedjei TaxID=2358 RepID=A0A9D6V4N2_9BACT|nr:hypothetical protein [Desulfomonile tiedjei]
MVRRDFKGGSKFIVRVYKKGQPATRWGGPGRAGPALDGLFVEPTPLDFWKLEKSFRLSKPSRLFACPKTIRRFVQRFREGSQPTLSPYRRQACLMVIAFFVVPSSNLTDSVSQDARRCSQVPNVSQEHGGLLIIEIVQTSRGRHSRSASPEIPGRIVFFVTAVGRSPPFA